MKSLLSVGLSSVGAMVFLLALGHSATDAAEARYADSWILVRMVAALDEDAAGRPVLGPVTAAFDLAIKEAGVTRAELALGASAENVTDRRKWIRFGFDRTYRFHLRPGNDIPAIVDRFQRLPVVEWAEPDFIGKGSALPNDPRFSDQEYFDQPSDADVDAPEAWDRTVGSARVIAAVLDTGIDSNHEDFAGKAVAGYDFANNDSNPEDDHGHGSNVASILGATTNNSVGIAGTCWNCKIMPIKALNSENWGYYSWWADGLVWATDNGARVINMSMGGDSPSQTLLDGIVYATDAGCVVAASMMNENSNVPYYPAAYSETIAVAATDPNDLRAEPFCWGGGSSYGNHVDVTAPGEWILGVAMGGGYNYWCGTSQATPIVTGLAGLIQSMLPSAGREEIRHLIQSGAEDQVGRPSEDTPGFDIYHGWGRINADRTLSAVESMASLRVAGKESTRPYLNVANPLADSYDFIRGDLASLAESSAGVDLGTVLCLENDSTDPDTTGNEDTGSPAAGAAFFYLARFNSAPGAGSYGGSSMNRDRIPAAADCSP